MDRELELMQPPRDARLLAQDEAGVSAVIGAVLVFGLMSTAFIMWSFTTLPVWVADNEEARADDVERSFSSLRSGLDLLATDGSAGPITASIPLSSDEVPLLQPAPSTGSLGYEIGFGWDGTFNSATSHLVDGVVDGDPSSTVNGAQLTDVAAMDALTLSIDGTTGDNIVVTATDGAANVVQATVALAANSNCGGNAIQTTVASPFTSDRVSNECVGPTLSNYRFNLLRNDLGFTSQLNRLAGTFTVDMTTTTSSTFGAIWRNADDDIFTDGTGIAAGTVDRDVDTGRVVFDPVNYHAVDQDIIWEGGSIIRSQSEGAAIAQNPEFSLSVSGGVGHLRWTIVDLSGTGALSGTGLADVVVTYTGQDERLISTTSGTIVIDSIYSEAWTKFLEGEVLVGGATGAAVVTQGTDQTTLTLTNVGVTEWLVHFRILSASAVVGG